MPIITYEVHSARVAERATVDFHCERCGHRQLAEAHVAAEGYGSTVPGLFRARARNTAQRQAVANVRRRRELIAALCACSRCGHRSGAVRYWMNTFFMLVLTIALTFGALSWLHAHPMVTKIAVVIPIGLLATRAVRYIEAARERHVTFLDA